MERLPKGYWGIALVVMLVGGITVWRVLLSEPAPKPHTEAGTLTSIDLSQAANESQPMPESPEHTAEIAVHVAGAVKQPGVVRLKQGSRVDDAVKAAGGFSAQADPDSINLAQLLEDGVQVYVPRKSETEKVEGRVGMAVPTRAVTPSGSQSTPSGLININTATAEELESLPGIGPVIARAILDYRRQNGGFRTIEELLEVRGIGVKRLEQIRPYVTVQ